MKLKGGLGKGLGALLSTEDIYDLESPGFFLCPIEKIRPNPDQPRKHMDQDSLEGLAKSIKEKGILQPLVVWEIDGAYELIVGERRWRAAQKAGLKAVPVVIKDVSPDELLELALVENVQREDLNPLEEAMAYSRLIDELGLTQSQVASRVGRERSTVANFLRLLQLPDYAQADLLDGGLSMGHARAILMLEDPTSQKELRDQIIKKDLSVRQAEALARRLAKGKRLGARVRREDPDIRTLCEDLTHRLGSKVTILQTKRGGRLEIRYRSIQELERIIRLLKAVEEGDGSGFDHRLGHGSLERELG
ncbi:MAG: ParB/RepB/Spo0J family partition protein [Deltaproteobacteria bacterium]|nr:ParB/RepB/Spo0J family partition protein [Deltaproteobacteria bacterium]